MSYPLVPRDLNVPQNRRNSNLNSIQSRKSRTTRQDVVDLNVTGQQTVDEIVSSNTLTIESSKAAADAIVMNTTNAAGGVQVTAGTGGVSITSTGVIAVGSSSANTTTYIRNGASGANTKTCTSTAITNATTTLTRVMIYGGIIECTSSGGAVALTTDTAALIIGGLTSPAVGDTFEVQLVNVGANTVTITAGSGVTTFGSLVISANSSRILRFQLTNVTASSEAVRLTL